MLRPHPSCRRLNGRRRHRPHRHGPRPTGLAGTFGRPCRILEVEAANAVFDWAAEQKVEREVARRSGDHAHPLRHEARSLRRQAHRRGASSILGASRAGLASWRRRRRTGRRSSASDTRARHRPALTGTVCGLGTSSRRLRLPSDSSAIAATEDGSHESRSTRLVAFPGPYAEPATGRRVQAELVDDRAGRCLHWRRAQDQFGRRRT